ncbi:MAG: Lon protease 1 [Mycoplasmataceae bacterium]|nr:MAG: Lon protease 1 [Mycoplasmataceae bacterium]
MKKNPLPILLTDNFFIFPSCSQVLNLENNNDLKKTLISSWKSGEGKILIISSKIPLNLNDEYLSDNFFSFGSLVKVEIDLSSDANIEIVFNSLRDIQLIGLERVEISEIFKDSDEDVWKGNYDILREDLSLSTPQEVRSLNDLTVRFVKYLPNLLKNNNITMSDSLPYLAIGDLSNFVDFVVQNSNNLERDFKQLLLEEFKLWRRLKLLLELEKKTRKIQQNINTKINEKILDQQKAAYLREQLEEIKSQLDKMEGIENEREVYLKRLENESFPDQVKKIVREEIKNYDKMHSQSSEANIIRSHIDWLMNLPWYNTTDEKDDLNLARQELDKEHFGLEKIKERIIEHLAVIQKTKNSIGNVICFVGPPGVGKTSLASSIAKATGRNFVRMSVGGISDEAEIRGHRRTYVGALPGKIIQEMKKAKVINPLFLIDEIDKISSGRFHGDPSNALLEILDPNQNSKFIDNYLGEIPYDLSKVLFICTANSTDFPQPLLDRMEIVNLSSYTELEKLHIAKNHLIPKNLNIYNLNSSSDNEITFTDDSIKEIIRFYTQEAGVRELNRMIQKIIRKFIVEILKNESKTLKIDSDNIYKYLGKKIYDFTSKKDSSQVGVVTGLAYTYSGGDILSIEVGFFKGKGKLILTGTLGDVMKESANISLDYIKSNYEYFGINDDFFQNNDIHIHVPEGSTPKDGPSAGIALTSAIISALTNKKISYNIGMTGEITLRGHVLPIGGLKEKSIAAHRSGLKTIIIPSGNDKNLEDIPQEVKDKLEIILVKEYKEVWKILTELDLDI